MKDILKIFTLILIIIITGGCTKDIKCKNTFDGDIKYKVTIESDVIQGNVVDAEATMVFEDKYDADDICELNKLLYKDRVKILCDGKKVIIKGYEVLEYNSDEDSITKDKFIENLEKQGFSC